MKLVVALQMPPHILGEEPVVIHTPRAARALHMGLSGHIAQCMHADLVLHLIDECDCVDGAFLQEQRILVMQRTMLQILLHRRREVLK